MTWLLVGAALAIMFLNVGMLVRMLLVLDELHEFATTNVLTQDDMQAAARVVAEDLEARYVRADAVEDGTPGEAADVAARSEPDA